MTTPTPAEPTTKAIDDGGPAKYCNHDLVVSPAGSMCFCLRCDRVGMWRDGMWEWQHQDSLGKGPFIASEYVGLPGDRIMFVATDPSTGISCGGRDEHVTAKGDARALNAAFWIGFMHGRDSCGKPDDAIYRMVVRWAVSRGTILTPGLMQSAFAFGYIQTMQYFDRLESDGLVVKGSAQGIWAATTSDVPERFAIPSVASLAARKGGVA
mgnify:CR=1 FL=1